jgi:hypothetical protein
VSGRFTHPSAFHSDAVAPTSPRRHVESYWRLQPESAFHEALQLITEQAGGTTRLRAAARPLPENDGVHLPVAGELITKDDLPKPDCFRVVANHLGVERSLCTHLRRLKAIKDRSSLVRG